MFCPRKPLLRAICSLSLSPSPTPQASTASPGGESDLFTYCTPACKGVRLLCHHQGGYLSLWSVQFTLEAGLSQPFSLRRAARYTGLSRRVTKLLQHPHLPVIMGVGGGCDQGAAGELALFAARPRQAVGPRHKDILHDVARVAVPGAHGVRAVSWLPSSRVVVVACTSEAASVSIFGVGAGGNRQATSCLCDLARLDPPSDAAAPEHLVAALIDAQPCQETFLLLSVAVGGATATAWRVTIQLPPDWPDAADHLVHRPTRPLQADAVTATLVAREIPLRAASANTTKEMTPVTAASFLTTPMGNAAVASSLACPTLVLGHEDGTTTLWRCAGAIDDSSGTTVSGGVGVFGLTGLDEVHLAAPEHATPVTVVAATPCGHLAVLHDRPGGEKSTLRVWTPMGTGQSFRCEPLVRPWPHPHDHASAGLVAALALIVGSLVPADRGRVSRASIAESAVPASAFVPTSASAA